MKPLITLFLFIIICQNSFAQYEIRSMFKKEFDSLFADKKKYYKTNRLRFLKHGFAFIEAYKTDTLNIEDYTGNKVEDWETEKYVDSVISLQNKTKQDGGWLATEAETFNDTLSITSFGGFFAGFRFTLNFFDSSCIAHFLIWADEDYYKQNINDEADDSVSLNAKILKLVLSEKTTLHSRKVYGKVTLLIDPFYSENGRFKSEYIYTQSTVTYWFTCKIHKAEYVDAFY
jgi:hypothetical protein